MICLIAGVTKTPTATPSTSNVTPTRSPTPYSCTHGWTIWLNVDNPSVDHVYETEGPGDYELITRLHEVHSFCARPVSIRCRTTDNLVPSHRSGDAGVVCDLTQGLVCVNADQKTGRCHNYEVSLLCECERKFRYKGHACRVSYMHA